ncbi:MAG: hypothetical protein HC860_16670 [Alkalinema sp. RU_4_3]|nr:hypothetical protein [Alkalinema sp. RU_4_3]
MPCESFFPGTETTAPLQIELTGPERWTIGDRLRQLGMTATCTMGEPLRIEVSTAQAAVQCWAVVRSYQVERSQLADWLEGCFRMSVSK